MHTQTAQPGSVDLEKSTPHPGPLPQGEREKGARHGAWDFIASPLCHLVTWSPGHLVMQG